ncbi:MAG TPA: zf-TFIIB domain-containing protein [Terriglobia bacterium]|nr:zf-TFIIB domain-containing protein [Terriglobia bacterium]
MEQQVGSLKCPNCGGEATLDSATCSWCGSSLATVACPRCFASIFVGMKHCPFCGAEATQAVQGRPAQLKCPRCDVGLVQVELGGIDLSECQRCGGLWVDKSAFQKICEEREEQEAVLGMASPVSAGTTKNTTQNLRMYVPCPLCGNLMNRLNFAGCSGVVIDWCKQHGSWFDYQELEQIVNFIRSGGLKKSRERELDKIREESQRLKEQERHLLFQQSRQSEGFDMGSVSKQDHKLLSDILSAIWKGMPKS